MGFQIINLGLYARFYSLTSHLDVGQDLIAEWIGSHFSLENGMLLGGGLCWGSKSSIWVCMPVFTR